MYSVKNLIKVMSYFATAVIFITAVSLFDMQGDDGRAYAADAVASISVTPIQSVLDVSDRRTVYRYDDSTVSYYLPISSPFSIPSALLTGAIDIPQALLAIMVLCVFVVLMALLVARVYEQIILHTGNRLKLGDILGLVKSK